jgi:hypothetical protein
MCALPQDFRLVALTCVYLDLSKRARLLPAGFWGARATGYIGGFQTISMLFKHFLKQLVIYIEVLCAVLPIRAIAQPTEKQRRIIQ